MTHAGLPRLISSGGDQAGRRCLLTIIVDPNHCLSGRPTPTGYRIARPFPTTKYRLRWLVRTTIVPAAPLSENSTTSRARTGAGNTSIDDDVAPRASIRHKMRGMAGSQSDILAKV